MYKPADDSVATAFQRSLADQFPSLSVRRVDLACIRHSVVGLVGMRRALEYGSVGIAAATKTLEHLHPDVGDGVPDLSDWIGELANQLLGRFKLGLRSRASTIRTSTPVVLHNAEVRLRRRAAVHVFIASDGLHEVIAWFDTGLIGIANDEASIGPGVEFLLPGDIELFDEESKYES